MDAVFILYCNMQCNTCKPPQILCELSRGEKIKEMTDHLEEVKATLLSIMAFNDVVFKIKKFVIQDKLSA